MAVLQGPIAHTAARLERNFDQALGRVMFTATTVYAVSQLADGSARQEVTILTRSLAASGLPQMGSPYPGEPGQLGCVLVGHSVQPIQDVDSAVFILCNYATIVPLGPLLPATIISVERDTVLQEVSEQLHPSNLTQMIVQPPPGMPNNTPGTIVDMRFLRPLTRLTITASVTAKNFTAVEEACGCVNNTTWAGYPIGYWRFDHYRQQSTNANLRVTVECSFLTKRSQSWLQYEVGRYEMLGVRQKVPESSLKLVRKLKYFYGWTSYPGIVVSGNHPLANFRSLLGIF